MNVSTTIQGLGVSLTCVEEAPKKKSLSKVDRHGWSPLGVAGTMQLVHKRDLQIDADYQRGAINSKVLAIARNFMWPAFGVASVARRPDGTMWVFDAQHRVLATWQRDDITHVPCIVYDVATVSEEARLFIQANTLRKPLTSVDKHKAAVVAEDPVAAVVAELAVQAGRNIQQNSSANSVRCIAMLRNYVERDEALVRRMWPLIVRVCEGAIMHERVVETLLFIEDRIRPERTLLEKHLSALLVKRGAAKLNQDAGDMAAALHRGGVKVWAEGVLGALNKGRREENHLVIKPYDPAKETA